MKKKKIISLKKVFAFLTIILLLSLVSCEDQKDNPKVKEIKPELMHTEGVSIDANVKTKDLSPGDTLNVFLTITNYLTSQTSVQIVPIPTPYLTPEKDKINFDLQSLSELYPKGYEKKLRLRFKVDESIREEKSFDLAIQYCYHVLYEKELPVCLDFVKAGYSKVPGCKFSPLTPKPEGSPVVIRKIDEQIKKYTEEYSVRFLVYLDALNKTIFLGNSCDDVIRYKTLRVSLSFEGKEQTKLFYLDGTKNYVAFEFKLNQKQNYLSKLKIRLDYFVDDSVTLNDLHIIPLS